MANDSAASYPLWSASGSIPVIAGSVESLPLWVGVGGGGPMPSLPLWIASGHAIRGVVGGSVGMYPFALWSAAGAGHTNEVPGVFAASSDQILDLWEARGTGFVGVIGGSQVTLPIYRVSGVARRLTEVGTSSVEWPMFLPDGTTLEVLGTTFVSLAVNTELRGQTSIEGWAFNSFAVLNGKIIGATDGALIELTGDDDDGAPIAAQVRTHITDLDTAKHKRANALIVGYRTDGDLMLAIIIDEHDEQLYRLEAPGHEVLATGRVKIGKGLRGRYWQLELSNVDGCDFDLDQIKMDLIELSRVTG